MSREKTLKERIRAGEEIKSLRLPMSSSREQVQEAIRQDPVDLLYIDAQHGPVSEWDIVRICSAAEALGVPVQMRIRHLREVYLIGHYLDLGLFGIKVPEVEEEAWDQGVVKCGRPALSRGKLDPPRSGTHLGLLDHQPGNGVHFDVGHRPAFPHGKHL